MSLNIFYTTVVHLVSPQKDITKAIAVMTSYSIISWWEWLQMIRGL